MLTVFALHVVSACASAPPPEVGTRVQSKSGTIAMEAVAHGPENITDLQFAMGRMVATTQPGKLVWFDEKGKSHTWKKIDVIDRSERGLLGLAFHPAYATNGLVVLSWTVKSNEVVVSRIGLWKTKPGSKPGDSPLEQGAVLFEVAQPWSNHNGGGIAFGPDNKLYIGFGDGGKANDTLGSGQDGSTALGTILRLDVDAPAPHIPPDNPFVGDPNVIDAAWAIGLRNPWRFSFAPDGRLVVADVGQNKWEELDFVPRGGNLGWNMKEGRECFDRPACEGDFVEPFWVYGRDQGISITGGYVATSGALKGQYLFGDFGSQRIWAAPLPAGGASLDAVTLISEGSTRPATFGRDEQGRVYTADFGSGTIYRFD